MKASQEPVVVSRKFPCPAARVWEAISEIAQMRSWYFDNIPDFQARQGFRTSFMVISGERSFLHQWEVVEVIPGRRLSYTWDYAEYPGKALVIWTIDEKDNSSTLTVSMLIKEDFPDGIEEFTRESCLAGWRYFIDDSLRTYLEQTT